MSYLYSDTPIGIFLVVMLCVIAVSIYAIFDMKKKSPGNPAIKLIPVFMVEAALLGLKKIIDEVSTNALVIKISDIVMYVAIILFAISLVITFLLAEKKGYIDKQKAAETKNFLKWGSVVVIILIIIIIIVSKM